VLSNTASYLDDDDDATFSRGIFFSCGGGGDDDICTVESRWLMECDC